MNTKDIIKDTKDTMDTLNTKMILESSTNHKNHPKLRTPHRPTTPKHCQAAYPAARFYVPET